MGFSIMEITQATSKQIVYTLSVYKAVVQDFFVYYQRTSVKYILCTLVLHVPNVIVYKNPDPSTNSRTLYYFIWVALWVFKATIPWNLKS